ncbi:N-acetylglucosamine-6-phosphate deacetylase [Aquibacillus kalidii]|uniref:N-acetylglucosamine-6-phosphate deacetylase n=1 Tax=Aquibacillus kalidii TaxID=2762597 RepID=UPI0016456B69|nr:N-acetylglucosamine-6-phosphate deacetylase [Aquibacillus kalidii]
MVKNKTILTNIQIHTEQRVIPSGYIKFENGKITDVNDMSYLSGTGDYQTIELPSSYKAIPGMIDIHIHGAGGADVMDATTESLQIMATTLPKEGTTGFLATTITQNQQAIDKALENVNNFIETKQQIGQSEIIGIHLEGPFINKIRAGAQPTQFITNPDLALFKKWQVLSNNHIKIVTLAPEQPNAMEFIRYLKQQNIISSVGHSDATLEQVDQAVAAGLSQVTHLFNQMREFHHREPGVVGAALLRDDLIAEIITDGIHVHPNAVQLAFQQKTADRLILITDAIRAKCLRDGTYELGGQRVTVESGKVVLDDGTLAGSVLTMGQAFKNILSFSNCSIKEAILMSSVNPAKQLNIFDRKGSIENGKDADIVILNENNDIIMTYCRGKLAFNKGAE